ncbi:hypothetical protein [Streptomyces sp. NPDC086023]|uniref:hypothetical protein n=1 Tax=Streptomyces sp. NPDC086023 TaxID=3365746 RepID=UPI0037D13550
MKPPHPRPEDQEKSLIPDQQPIAPHFTVCLQMLTLAARYARCFDVLDDRTLSSPTAGERIGQLLVTVESLAHDAAALSTAHRELPMSLIDHRDLTVSSRIAQLQVVTSAAAEALAHAVEGFDATSAGAIETRLTSVQAARDLLATAASDLVGCAERVAAEMHRYRSSYSIPEVGAHVSLTAERLQVLRLVTAGAVSVDEDGHTWVGMNKDAVRASVLRYLDQQGLITAEPSASWADEIRVASTSMGRLVLAATLSRPERREDDHQPAPTTAPAVSSAPARGAR